MRQHVLCRRSLLAGGVMLPGLARAQPTRPVRIGVLGDASGMAGTISGPPVVAAVRLAIGDGGRLPEGQDIQVLSGTFNARPDEALAIARTWFMDDGVIAVLDVPGMNTPSAVQRLATRFNRAVLNTGSINADLYGAECSVTATHWADDMRAMAAALARASVKDSRETWFLIHLDTAIGTLVQREAAKAIAAAGGRVVGVSRRPEGTQDYATVFAHARDSGARMIGFCDPFDDLAIQVAQARAAGVSAPDRTPAAFLGTLMDVKRLGADAAGLWLARSFYWNDNDLTRGFARRFLATTGRMPDSSHAAAYAATRHLLRAIAEREGLDGIALNRVMRRMPAYLFGSAARPLPDGRVPREMAVYRVRANPSTDWDLLEKITNFASVDPNTTPLSPRCARPG